MTKLPPTKINWIAFADTPFNGGRGLPWEGDVEVLRPDGVTALAFYYFNEWDGDDVAKIPTWLPTEDDVDLDGKHWPTHWRQKPPILKPRASSLRDNDGRSVGFR